MSHSEALKHWENMWKLELRMDAERRRFVMRYALGRDLVAHPSQSQVSAAGETAKGETHMMKPIETMGDLRNWMRAQIGNRFQDRVIETVELRASIPSGTERWHVQIRLNDFVLPGVDSDLMVAVRAAISDAGDWE